MTKLPAILTIAALSAFTLSTPTSAAPWFDSDCVGTQWVIRNGGPESFLVSTPAGEAIGMVDIGTVYEPDDSLASVIIGDQVVIRPSCEVLAVAPNPTRLPDTGTSLNLAMLALALMATGAVAWRVGQNSDPS